MMCAFVLHCVFDPQTDICAKVISMLPDASTAVVYDAECPLLRPGVVKQHKNSNSLLLVHLQSIHPDRDSCELGIHLPLNSPVAKGCLHP